MKIFIDFDDVIFNTKQFKDDIANIFFNHGISRELYEQSYYDPDDVRAVKTYDPSAQISRLKKIAQFDEGAISVDIEQFLGDASRYVFLDVKPFVDRYGSRNVFVLSYGDIIFQNRKIDSSRIREYMPGVFVTDTLKADMLGKALAQLAIPESETVYFLDDRVEQIHSVKERFPWVRTILIKRPEGRYQDMKREECCDYEMGSLRRAQEIIRN